MRKLLPSPLFFAGLYFAAIPVFALFYYRMPNQFYQPEVRREAGFKADEDVVGKLIGEEVVRRYRRDGKDGIVTSKEGGESWDMNTASATAKYVEVGGQERLEVYIFVVRSERKGGDIEAKRNPTNAHFYLPLVDDGGDFYDMELDKEYPGGIPPEIFFPEAGEARFPFFGGDPLFGGEVVEAIRRLHDGANGVSSSVSENYSRMLYFSVTTITTVGFGDIVPISGAARACVGFEAILGIVLIGLFINAVGLKASEVREAR